MCGKKCYKYSKAYNGLKSGEALSEKRPLLRLFTCNTRRRKNYGSKKTA